MHWRHPTAILEVKRWRNNRIAQICTRGAQDCVQWTTSFWPLGEGALLKWRHVHKIYSLLALIPHVRVEPRLHASFVLYLCICLDESIIIPWHYRVIYCFYSLLFPQIKALHAKWLLAKHSMVLTDHVSKFNISTTFNYKQTQNIPRSVAMFPTNSTLFFNLRPLLLTNGLSAFVVHLWLSIVF